MNATHNADTYELYTISAGGFSATADAFARDEESETLWFLSMVGSQTALKAIWASLLKQPPESAHIISGADGMALSGGYQRCIIPFETIGTWTTRIARLPVSGGWHALVYTRTAEYAFERGSFLLLAQSEDGAPALHHRFPRQTEPVAAARLVGRMALGTGPERGRDSPPPIGRCLRLQVCPKCRTAQGRPLQRGGGRTARSARGGGAPQTGRVKRHKKNNEKGKEK